MTTLLFSEDDKDWGAAGFDTIDEIAFEKAQIAAEIQSEKDDERARTQQLDSELAHSAAGDGVRPYID